MLLLEEMIDSFNDLFIRASLCDGLITGVVGLLLPCVSRDTEGCNAIL